MLHFIVESTHELFVIFVQSPRYYQSPISLNEMGAVWVLQKEYYSILTKDMNYEGMKGVFDKSKIAFNVGDENAKYRLNELKDKIFKFLKIKSGVDETRWERERDKFLKEVNK